MRLPLVLLVLLCIASTVTNAQDSLSKPLAKDYVYAVSRKANLIQKRLQRQNIKLIVHLQRQEARLRKKLGKIDSAKAASLFNDNSQVYTALKKSIQHPSKLQGYIPDLDTLKTTFSFLHFLSVDSANSEELEYLEQSLSGAEVLEQFISRRSCLLRENLLHLPLSRNLQKWEQYTSIYKVRVTEYTALLKDKSKWEQKAMELLMQSSRFHKFMQEHSQLASLFRMPENADAAMAAGSGLPGLQTRAQLTAILQNNFGNNASALIRDNLQQSQVQLSDLRAQAAQLASSVAGQHKGEGNMPDYRTPQNTKTFRQRLELGTNLQTVKGNRYFPITSDLGLSLGYRFATRGSAGVGASYRLGWGSGWNNIRLSHQGVGLRSYLDWQLKGSVYVAGGYEQNYRSHFHSVVTLHGISSWQKSGLLGLSKKYKAGKKLQGSFQLLWDFLSYNQVPRTQPIIFRTGFNFSK